MFRSLKIRPTSFNAFLLSLYKKEKSFYSSGKCVVCGCKARKIYVNW